MPLSGALDGLAFRPGAKARWSLGLRFGGMNAPAPSYETNNCNQLDIVRVEGEHDGGESVQYHRLLAGA